MQFEEVQKHRESMQNELVPSPSVRTLPSNRSVVVADSAYRDVSSKDQWPYRFVCNLNAALTGKELVYSKLYWNQPLFSHNNGNNELRFQINGDDSVTYVVYATPFLTFQEFDGNPPGTSFLPPQPYSYADNMEKGLFGDVRDLANNAVLINGNSGVLEDADGFVMYPRFRYSPSRGFVFSFEPSTNAHIPVYTLRLLPCSYIANAHFVHGFGIATVESGGEYVPRDEWTVSYFSDDTPTLLPLRYITVTSPELTKDRRMISFQNSGSARSLNELAIFPLNKDYTCAYHTELTGEDATVISKRDDYNPQSFSIIITNEQGNALQCSNPIARILQDPTVSLSTKQSFVFDTATLNRGNNWFTNLLLFGTTSPVNRLGYAIYGYPMDVTPMPVGTSGLWRPNAAIDDTVSNIFTQLTQIQQKQCAFTLYVLNTNLTVGTGQNPYNTGFSDIVDQHPATPGWGMYNSTPNPPAPAANSQNIRQSRLTWYPDRNPNPICSFDLRITINGSKPVAPASLIPSVNFIIGLYSYTTNEWVAATIAFKASYQMSSPYVGQTVLFTNDYVNPFVLKMNPAYAGVTTPQNVQLFLMPYGYNSHDGSNGQGQFCFAASFDAPPYGYIGGKGIPYSGYNPPNVGGDSNNAYSFGNPLADGLCEEVIHEMVTILKDN